MLQNPTLSKTHIVFVYAGDLWSVPRAGGDAARLTSGPRRYAALQVGKPGTLLVLEAPGLPADGPPEAGPGLTVHRYDLKTRKSDVPLAGVSGFQMSYGGEKALARARTG